VGPTGTTAGSALGDFVGLGLGCTGIFPFEEKKLRGLFDVEISTASMITFGRTGVVGLGVTGSSFLSSSGSSSSTTLWIFFVVRGREVLVVNLEEPALVVVTRAAARADVLGGGLTGGLVEGGFFDGGFAWTVTPSAAIDRTPGGLPRRLGASVVSTSVARSTSMDTTVVLSVNPFGGTFSVLDDPVATLDRVTLALVLFFVGSDDSGT
jgi:hypothetical protein